MSLSLSFFFLTTKYSIREAGQKQNIGTRLAENGAEAEREAKIAAY